MILQQDGAVSQEILKNKKVVLFGLGSVGSSIAILLARMGIGNFVFIDYKKLDDSHTIKHFYSIKTNRNQYKCEALKEYLQKIHSQLTIKCFNEKIVPLSALEDYIPSDTAMISSADELYIRHASIKIGRYVWTKNIPMYVAGGFDAHSMSTGEMIVPHVTSCIDCYWHTPFKNLHKDFEELLLYAKDSEKFIIFYTYNKRKYKKALAILES